jgi:hypothetical protein
MHGNMREEAVVSRLVEEGGGHPAEHRGAPHFVVEERHDRAHPAVELLADRHHVIVLHPHRRARPSPRRSRPARASQGGPARGAVSGARRRAREPGAERGARAGRAGALRQGCAARRRSRRSVGGGRDAQPQPLEQRAQRMTHRALAQESPDLRPGNISISLRRGQRRSLGSARKHCARRRGAGERCPERRNAFASSVVRQ